MATTEAPATLVERASARLAKLQRLAELKARALEVQRDRNRDRLEHYAAHPAAWARDSLVMPRRRAAAGYQLEILELLAEHHRVAARGPRGMGKTTTASWAVLWFASTRDALGLDWKILTTAGVLRHLTRALWPEVHKWAPRLSGLYVPPTPEKQLLTASLHLDHGQAYGAVARDPAMIEGAHADEILILIDEAKSVPEAIWDALEGALTGEEGQYALALSTPGQPAGRFYEIHAGRHPDWVARHVTTDEAVEARRISRRWVQARAAGWGEESALYRQQALGEFAADDENAVVPLSWVEAAFLRWEAWREAGRPPLEGERSVAVDVATTGADKTVLAQRHGRHIFEFRYTSAGGTMDTVGKVQEVVTGKHKDTRPVTVDVIGVGVGVADRLTELGYKVERYNGAASTSFTDRSGDFGFVNTRSAAYWHLRELLSPDVPEAEAVMLPPNQQLLADLTTPTWRITTGSPPKIAIETKVDLHKRLGRSPDFGDAVAMAYWLDAMRTPITMAPTPAARLSRRGLSPLGK